MCHGPAARRQRRELPCVRHDGIEMSSEFQTKPPLVAICVCPTRLQLTVRLFASDVVEPSESWMTAVSIRAPAAADAAPPPLVGDFRRPLTENRTSSQKSEHVMTRAIAAATTSPADPSACERVRDRQVFPKLLVHFHRHYPVLVHLRTVLRTIVQDRFDLCRSTSVNS